MIESNFEEVNIPQQPLKRRGHDWEKLSQFLTRKDEGTQVIL